MLAVARFKWCPETELNRHVPFGTRDFKSRASASFAIRAGTEPIEENISVDPLVPSLQISHSPVTGAPDFDGPAKPQGRDRLDGFGVCRIASPGAIRTNGHNSAQMVRFQCWMPANVLAALPQPRTG
jgi:hypothetical protein